MSPQDLHQKAAEDLRFIRETMNRSATFTDVPGKHLMVIGAWAVAVSLVLSFSSGIWPLAWHSTWILTAFLAISYGLTGMIRKAKAAQHPIGAGAFRKFVIGLTPALFAGLIFTAALLQDGTYYDKPASVTPLLTLSLPALWLVLYGVAIVSASANSIRILTWMGLCFMTLGTVSLVAPALTPNLLMGLGFGGFHLIFGWIIARQHGG